MPAQETSSTDWSDASKPALPLTISRLAYTVACAGEKEKHAIALMTTSSDKEPLPLSQSRAALLTTMQPAESLLCA